MDIPAAQITVTGTTATVTGLTAGTTYYFQVAATNAGGDSSFTVTNATTTVSSGIQPPNNVKTDVTGGSERFIRNDYLGKGQGIRRHFGVWCGCEIHRETLVVG
jgi:hypothetical protein